MSGPAERAPASAAPLPSLKSQRDRLGEGDREELSLLGAQLQRIKASVPAAPYILSTPSFNEYKHHSRQEEGAWMMGRLFDINEEHLQYRTYHYREPYQSCFVLQHGEQDEPQAERPKSQPSGTPYLGPKKKISLSAYKSKQANGAVAPGSKHPLSAPAPANPPPIRQNGLMGTTELTPSPPKRDHAAAEKRLADESLALEKRPTEDSRPPQPLAETQGPDSKMDLCISSRSNGTPHGLPPLLSPVNQPLNNPYGLPAILSPTLPSSVQAELDKLEKQRSRGDSNASSSSSGRKSQLLAMPEPHRLMAEEDMKAVQRAKSTPMSGKSPGDTRNHRAIVSDQTLVVKLKYGKRHSTTVTKILRLPASRKAQFAAEVKDRPDSGRERPVKTQPKATDGATNKIKDISKSTSHAVPTSTPSTKATSTGFQDSEKRLLSEDDVSVSRPSKRPKPSQDGPSTPSRQIVSSPAISSSSSAQKSQGVYATPRKDIKTINMLRTNSTEGYDTTPGRSGSTPASAKHIDVKTAPTSVPVGAKKQSDCHSLSQISQRLNNMGRSLKHQVQKVVIDKGAQLTKEDNKRAAVTSLECILSYMAAYGAQDQSNNLRGRPGDVEATWKTLLPLCMSYSGRTKEFPHLEGLRLYFCAAICAAICSHVASRATRAKLHGSPQDTAQPELAKQFNHIADNFALLSDHYMHLTRAAQDARIVLPVEDIQQHYPKTWAGREPDARIAKGAEKLSAGNLSGPYFIPIQNDTTPFQAVRFGLRFLDEYCQKEKLNYTLRVTLDMSE